MPHCVEPTDIIGQLEYANIGVRSVAYFDFPVVILTDSRQ